MSRQESFLVHLACPMTTRHLISLMWLEEMSSYSARSVILHCKCVSPLGEAARLPHVCPLALSYGLPRCTIIVVATWV